MEAKTTLPKQNVQHRMSCFEDFTDALPAIALCAIIIWSYYVYVCILCVNIITHQAKQIAYLTVYHILFVMMMLCYIVTLHCYNDGVPPRYNLGMLLSEMLNSNASMADVNRTLERFCRNRRIVVYTTNRDGSIRFCKTCEHVKPDRAHHCSTCNRCILKMDHHCPWVNNCIGYSNYKQFVLFLFYSSIYCVFTFGTLIEYVVQFFVGTISNYYGCSMLAL